MPNCLLQSTANTDAVIFSPSRLLKYLSFLTSASVLRKAAYPQSFRVLHPLVKELQHFLVVFEKSISFPTK